MATTSEIRAWLRAQNIEVGDKGALPARLIARYDAAHGGTGPRLLPGPDDDLPPLEDFGMVDVDVPPLERETPPSGPPPSGGPDPEPPEPGDDEPPAHMRRDWQDAPKRGSKVKPKPPRITQTIRADIQAKISFGLEIPGRIWQARDPVCGSVFIEQRAEIAESFTDIVVDSPDLVMFFTGPGGNFMKGLKVLAAVWPVVTCAMAHHVYHSIEAAEPPAEPDYQQYAA